MMTGPARRGYNLRVTDEQLEQLAAAAAGHGLSVRAFILKMTLGIEDIPDFRYKVNKARQHQQEPLPTREQPEGLRMTG